MELSHEVKVVKGLSAEWGICSRTVSLKDHIQSLSHWNNIIAVGSHSGDIIVLDVITGSQMAILSGHTDTINCLTFSSDGKSLISGSDDTTVKLWDVQTGGVAKTFHGNRGWVFSVSVSEDCTRIVSGSKNTINLWNIQTGECYWTIEQQGWVEYVRFSPTDPQHIISISGCKVWEWDMNGNQIPPVYDGSQIAFSPDHTKFALCNGNVIMVQNTDSRVVVAEINVTNGYTDHCCFSPDNKLFSVAVADDIAYVWDITSLDPHSIEIFVGYSDMITSLVFSSPSSLISASWDGSVKFWQVGVLSTDPGTTDPGSTSLTSAGIVSVSLQARAGIAISSDIDGVVKTWDLSTGLCKTSFQTPAAEPEEWGDRDAQLVDGKLIFAWYEGYKIHILDIEEGEFLQTLETPKPRCIRISVDGSKLFSLRMGSIQAWNMQTWELVHEVELGMWNVYSQSLFTESSRACVKFEMSSIQEGWDFGVLGSSPVPFDPSTGRPHFDFIGGANWQIDNPFWIKDTVTGKEVFQLRGIYAKPNDVEWDGQYLVASYESGEMLILDFYNVLSRDV